MADFSPVELNLAGIREILKSAGMDAELDKVGAEIAGKANNYHKPKMDLKAPMFRHHVDDTRYTHVVRVFTASTIGRRVQSKYQSLENSLHVR